MTTMLWLTLGLMLPALILQAILLWRHTIALKRMTLILELYTVAQRRARYAQTDVLFERIAEDTDHDQSWT